MPKKKQPLADRIVAEAETWLGTRFQHQGRIKGRGVDCAGFIAEVAKNVGVEADIPQNYRRHEDGKAMLHLLKTHMRFVPTEKMQKGDVLALCDEALQKPDDPKHVVFVKDVTPEAIFIIHVTETRGVAAHRLNSRWRERIHSCWRVKE